MNLINHNKHTSNTSLMVMQSTLDDLDDILNIYSSARNYQQSQGYSVWPIFSKEFIEHEMAQKRHFKIVVNNNLVAVFSIVYSEPIIWDDKEDSEAIYLHRIAIKNEYKGMGLMRIIIDWSKDLAIKMNRRFIRIDTWADNLPLTEYYQRLGFEFKGGKKLPAKSNLPDHYQNLVVNLFELKVANSE